METSRNHQNGPEDPSWEGRLETRSLSIEYEPAFAGHGGLPPHRAYGSVLIELASKREKKNCSFNLMQFKLSSIAECIAEP
jgi:hypothetical protein